MNGPSLSPFLLLLRRRLLLWCLLLLLLLRWRLRQLLLDLLLLFLPLRRMARLQLLRVARGFLSRLWRAHLSDDDLSDHEDRHQKHERAGIRLLHSLGI